MAVWLGGWGFNRCRHASIGFLLLIGHIRHIRHLAHTPDSKNNAEMRENQLYKTHIINNTRWEQKKTISSIPDEFFIPKSPPFHFFFFPKKRKKSEKKGPMELISRQIFEGFSPESAVACFDTENGFKITGFVGFFTVFISISGFFTFFSWKKKKKKKNIRTFALLYI
jgi:hypothetical protein